MAGVSIPAIVFLMAVAGKVVGVVLGSRWIDSAPILRALAPAALVNTVGVCSGWAFLSSGQNDRLLKWNLVRGGLQVTGIALGFSWGPVGIAAALSIVECSLAYPMFLYCFKKSPLKLSDLSSAIWRPAVASMSAVLVLYMWPLATPDSHTLQSLMGDVSVFGLSYLCLWILLPGGKEQLLEMCRMFSDLWRHREAS
jgi:PST family polysaccharide transporter